MRGWLVRSRRGEGRGCCEGRHLVDGGKNCRHEERRSALLAPALRGEVEGGR